MIEVVFLEGAVKELISPEKQEPERQLWFLELTLKYLCDMEAIYLLLIYMILREL